MQAETLFILFILLAVFQSTPDIFRARWTKQESIISAMEIALNNESDFMNLTTFSLDIFERK